MLIFFASCMKSEGFTLADVFSAGLRSLRGTEETSAATTPCDQAGQASEPAGRHPDSDLLPWRSLDEVPDDDDLAEDTGESSEDLPARHPGPLPAGQKAGISLPGPIPPSATAGKCSLITRSMAAVLEEQGRIRSGIVMIPGGRSISPDPCAVNFAATLLRDHQVRKTNADDLFRKRTEGFAHLDSVGTADDLPGPFVVFSPAFYRKGIFGPGA